jgi:hypothetical protein
MLKEKWWEKLRMDRWTSEIDDCLGGKIENEMVGE